MVQSKQDRGYLCCYLDKIVGSRCFECTQYETGRKVTIIFHKKPSDSQIAFFKDKTGQVPLNFVVKKSDYEDIYYYLATQPWYIKTNAQKRTKRHIAEQQLRESIEQAKNPVTSRKPTKGMAKAGDGRAIKNRGLRGTLKDYKKSEQVVKLKYISARPASKWDDWL